MGYCKWLKAPEREISGRHWADQPGCAWSTQDSILRNSHSSPVEEVPTDRKNATVLIQHLQKPQEAGQWHQLTGGEMTWLLVNSLHPTRRKMVLAQFHLLSEISEKRITCLQKKTCLLFNKPHKTRKLLCRLQVSLERKHFTHCVLSHHTLWQILAPAGWIQCYNQPLKFLDI